MNWPLLVVFAFLFLLVRLVFKAIDGSEEAHRRLAVKRHFQFLRDADVKPDEYHHFDYLLPPRRN